MGLLKAHAGMTGKVAAVIGGSAGIIGRAVSLGLAEAGVNIATCDNDEEGVRAIVPEIESLGRKSLSVYADVTDVEALDAFYEQVAKNFDRLDIVVNVA